MNFKVFLALVPVFTALLGMWVYKFQDRKKEIFRLDFVQFVYLFIMTPAMFVWIKSFLFYLLRNEIDFSFSITELFVIDTIFSVLSFFVLSAISIHTITKTFWIKRNSDPNFDIYHLSEYFHLWWSHIVIWGGIMLIGLFVSMTNIFVPLDVSIIPIQFYILVFLSIIFGVLFFFAIWISDPGQGNYMRLMKLFLAVSFLLQVGAYFIFDPVFNMSYGGFWFVFLSIFSASFCGLFFEKAEKKITIISKIRNWLLHSGWGDNINLFEIKK